MLVATTSKATPSLRGLIGCLGGGASHMLKISLLDGKHLSSYLVSHHTIVSCVGVVIDDPMDSLSFNPFNC